MELWTKSYLTIICSDGGPRNYILNQMGIDDLMHIHLEVLHMKKIRTTYTTPFEKQFSTWCTCWWRWQGATLPLALPGVGHAADDGAEHESGDEGEENQVDEPLQSIVTEPRHGLDIVLENLEV